MTKLTNILKIPELIKWQNFDFHHETSQNAVCKDKDGLVQSAF